MVNRLTNHGVARHEQVRPAEYDQQGSVGGPRPDAREGNEPITCCIVR